MSPSVFTKTLEDNFLHKKKYGDDNEMGIFGKSRPSTHYPIHVECSNCKKTGNVLAIKGTLREAAVKQDTCMSCGCQTLRMLTEAEWMKLNPPQVNSGGLFS